MSGNRYYGKFYTLNFDGSHNNQANKSGAGCVIRDSQGNLVVAAAYNLTKTYHDYCNVAIAEAVALRNGLKLAQDYNLNLNLIKGDTKEVIDHVLDLSRRPSRPPLSGIIQQIMGMIDPKSQKIVIIDREANQVADKLAFWGTNRLDEGGHMIFTSYDDLPPQVAGLIRQEKSCSSREDESDGEASSMAGSSLLTAGAAVFAAATIWGVSKLFGGSSSDQEHKNKAKASWDNVLDATRNFASMSLQDNDHYTLHFDGSDINQLQKGGAGCIIRNKQGDLVVAAAYNLDNLYPNQFHVAIAEAIAWRNGLKLANSKRIKLDIIKGDNQEVIMRVLGQERKAPGVSYLTEIIREIQEALHKQSIDPRTQVELIGREANKVANELASLGSKLGFQMEKSYARDEDLPFKVYQLVEQDKINWSGRGLLM